MNFKEAFVIDTIHFNDNINNSIRQSEPYTLHNHDYYGPKLSNDFYLNYFLYNVIFEINIIELDDFLEFHYKNCSNPNEYCKILDRIIAPTIKDVIDNAIVNWDGYGQKRKELEDDFYELDGVINKIGYDFNDMCQRAGLHPRKQEFVKRLNVVDSFIKSYCKDKNEIKKLKWIGEPSHLAYIISELVNQNYIDSPLKANKDINYSELTRNLINSFDIVKTVKSESLRKYASPDNEKYNEVDRNFKKEGFFIPYKGTLS